jgi:hypothetical protein
MGCGSCGGIIHGATGIAKAIVGADRADADTIKARAEACRCCPNHARGSKFADQPCKDVAWNSVCTGCSCLLVAKIRLASETCPAGKWPL